MTDATAARELVPFIIRRMEQGFSFEAAARLAPSDALEYARSRKAQVLGSVWDRSNRAG